jgi:DNA polymerase delta subunit 2
MLVTGCIIAVMGTENADGDFEVIDVKVPDLPPQPARWSSSSPPTATHGSGRKAKRMKIEDEDEDMDKDEPSSKSKIAIVSGLGFSGTGTENSLQTNLLIEFLLGEALHPASQKAVSQISRLIIAGNSLASNHEALSHDISGNSRKTHKKYGYDSSAYNPIPTAHLDDFLAALLPSLPVTLIPGASDPANISFPQQPIHTAMLPQARAYAAHPASTADEERVPGWLDLVTNPWEAEIDGWRVLGTGGQNVDDVSKYIECEDRLRVLEAICRWRCCAPTAPDTLCECQFSCIVPKHASNYFQHQYP